MLSQAPAASVPASPPSRTYAARPRRSNACVCRYRKAYEDYARALRAEYPHVTFSGRHFHPGEMKMMLAQMLQLAFFGGLAVSLVGRSLLPEPASKFIEQNQMPVLGACFM